ncbi:MAG TPA: hypothetical protein VGE52_15375, partial [Pirellulales bacterium]
LASNEIPPGGTCDVTLKWEPKAEFPMFRQTATIYTNDRTNQTINLEITGVVAKVLNFSPSDLTIAKIPAGEPREAYFTIYSPVTASFDLGNIEYSDPKTKDFFTIKSVAAGDATLKQFGGKSGYEFTVTIKPGLPLGHFRQRLKIHHSIPNIEPVEIPIAGSIVGDVSIKGGVGLWNEEAGVLLLGRVFQRQGLKQNLKLYVKDAPADFAVESVKSTPDDSLKVECSAPKRVGQVTVVDVQISIPPGTRTQVHMGTAAEPLGEIIIRTNHPRTPEVKMLVKFDVVDA